LFAGHGDAGNEADETIAVPFRRDR
jgi:hypothetical protein